MRRLALSAAVLLLAGCAGAPGGGMLGGRGRDRPPLPPRAQPTSVVATELAFARAAREQGQWTAYNQYAAPGAQVQWAGASTSAQSWLAGRANPPAADRWVPRQAWSSCDGSAVVIAGTSTDAAGNWSRFTRVWERQAGGDFRWVYTHSLPDAELTQARKERDQQRAADETLGGDVIEVEAGNFIRAKVAACTTPPPVSVGDLPSSGNEAVAGHSKDRTLRWGQDRSGSLAAFGWNGSGWDPVLAEPLAAAGE